MCEANMQISHALSCSNTKMFTSFQNLAAVLSESAWPQPFSAIKKKHFSCCIPPHFPAPNKIYHPPFPFFFALCCNPSLRFPEPDHVEAYWWITLSNVSEIFFSLVFSVCFCPPRPHLPPVHCFHLRACGTLFPASHGGNSQKLCFHLLNNQQCYQGLSIVFILYMCVVFQHMNENRPVPVFTLGHPQKPMIITQPNDQMTSRMA